MKTIKKQQAVDVHTNLKKLSQISTWFEEQEEINIEEGLVKVREASVLIRESRGRLKEIENEFNEIKKDIEEE